MTGGELAGKDGWPGASLVPPGSPEQAPPASAVPQPLFTRAEYFAALPQLRQAAFRQLMWSIPGLLIALVLLPTASRIIASWDSHPEQPPAAGWQMLLVLVVLILTPLLVVGKQLQLTPARSDSSDSPARQTRLALRLELLTGQAATSPGLGEDHHRGLTGGAEPATPLRVLLRAAGSLSELVSNPWLGLPKLDKVSYRPPAAVVRWIVAPLLLLGCAYLLYRSLTALPPVEIYYYRVAIIALWVVGVTWYGYAAQAATRQFYLWNLLQRELQEARPPELVERLAAGRARFDRLVLWECACANLAGPPGWGIVLTISDAVVGGFLLLVCWAGFETSKLLGLATTGGMLLAYFGPGWCLAWLNYRYAGELRQALAHGPLIGGLLAGELDPNRFNLASRWPGSGQRVSFPAALDPVALTAALRRVCFNLDWYLKPPGVAFRWHWLTELIAAALLPAFVIEGEIRGPDAGPWIDLGHLPANLGLLVLALPLSLLRWPAQWYIARKRVWARELKAALSARLDAEWEQLGA